jgi:soluble lytic murein transglycosylase-like protein
MRYPTPQRTSPAPRLRTLWPALLLWLGCTLPALATSPEALGPAELTEQALRYIHGEGVEPDPDRAVLYLCAAAQDGHAAAAYELGWLYLNARGVARDEALGAAWLREAVRLGEAAAHGVLERLAAVPDRPLWCVGSDGLPLQLAGAERDDLEAAIRLLAPHFGLDPDLVIEVVRAESNFDPQARSHKGALGLMQLIPATAARFGVDDPLEPAQNLRGGMAYLRWLLARFDGDLKLTLAGYNAGEGAVERHGGVPPYAETRAYVRRILGRYGKQHHPVPSQTL